MTDVRANDLMAGIVLAGGSGTRLGGVDKASLSVDGVTLVHRAVGALGKCSAVVVVGQQVPVPSGVLLATEEPAGGGPAAGLLAGVAALEGAEEWIAVVAVDMPFVATSTFDRLRAAAVDDGAVLVDAEGRLQYLCGVYRRAALLRAAETPEGLHGLPMRRLVEGLLLVEVPAEGKEAKDVDVPADLSVVDEDTRPIAFEDR